MNIVKKGNAFIYHTDDGNHSGKITFTERDNHVIIADHTWVEPSLRGQGIAEVLLSTLVDFARENGLKIEPQCSYVARVFEKHPERYQDVSIND